MKSTKTLSYFTISTFVANDYDRIPSLDPATRPGPIIAGGY